MKFFYGYKLEASHLRVFGCKYFAHVPKDETRKLDAKSIKCTFTGYCTKKNAYKLFDPISHKLITSTEVVFHENENKGDKMNHTSVWHTSNHNENHVKINVVVEHE